MADLQQSPAFLKSLLAVFLCIGKGAGEQTIHSSTQIMLENTVSYGHGWLPASAPSCVNLQTGLELALEIKCPGLEIMPAQLPVVS